MWLIDMEEHVKVAKTEWSHSEGLCVWLANRSDQIPHQQSKTTFNTSERFSIFKINHFDLFHPSYGAFSWIEYVYQQTLCVINKLTSIVLFHVSQLSKKNLTCS